MKKVILTLVIVLGIVLTNCSDTIFDGRIHPSNPKLHKIVVLKNYQWEINNTHRIEYFSFKDSAFHSAIIPILYKDLFQVGDTIN